LPIFERFVLTMKNNISNDNIRRRNLKRIFDTARGNGKADLAVLNASLLNVYTREVQDRYAVCTKDQWIAYVGQEPEDLIGKQTTVIDAKGQALIPGLIDGHAHLAWLYQPAEFLKYALAGGTTTIVTETLEAFPVAGTAGVEDFLASLKDQPVKIIATAPAMVSISRSVRPAPARTMKKLMQRHEVVGLGETYWQAVFQNPDSILPLFEETLLAGKTLEGHSAGATGKKLMAYIAAGISSCHEPIKAKEVLDRLRLGVTVMIREGSIRRDLEEISKLKQAGANFRRLTLVTDGLTPKDLLEKGYMEFVVQKAIDCGFDPITAIQMATLNVAEHFSLGDYLGGIAPGKYADFLIIPDLHTISPRFVISNGQVIARNGKAVVSPKPYAYSKASRNSVHLSKALKAADFSIHAKAHQKNAKVRVIDQITDLVTQEKVLLLPVENGRIDIDLKEDILKVAAIDRVHQPGKSFVGLVKGFALKQGAIASSAAWDTSDIIVVGANEEDMALAVNRVHQLQGGAVVCKNKKILAELPMPVMGIMSDLSIPVLTKKIDRMNRIVSGLGCPLNDPFLTLITLTGAAIPYLRICEEGLVNLKDGQTLGLFV
jgi:adenine deaminase